jgi:hypothetical protein
METRMETRKLKMICTKSKLGHSLSQISELTGLTIDQVKERLGRATGLSPMAVSIIFDMKQRGLSLELISQESDVELEVLKQFLPQDIKKTVGTHALTDQEQGPYDTNIGERPHTLGSDHCMNYSRSPPTTTEETKQSQPTKKTTPTFFYCCEGGSNKLRWVNLLTREQSYHKGPSYRFKWLCRWSELPGGRLLITGGISREREVVRIDTLREYAVSFQPPMHTGRRDHASVYHSQYLYVLGGYSQSWYLRKCERYSCAQSQWEVLPPLPVAGSGMSAVEVENSLYALGGGITRGMALDTVQKLNLDSLTWKLMQLKLPKAGHLTACFKTDTQVYLVIKNILFSFTPIQVSPIKTLPHSMNCDSSCYSRGTLYSATSLGVKSVAIGELA